MSLYALRVSGAFVHPMLLDERGLMGYPTSIATLRSWRHAFVRAGATVFAASAILASPLSAAHAEPAPALQSRSTTQMSSVPEVVYVTHVGPVGDRVRTINDNWKFYLGDASGAQEATFDDSAWSWVDLPHDYSIDQDYSKSAEGESAYKPGGVGWYRKTFEVSPDMAKKQVRVDFDGAYMDATVWINGHELGTHPYGYSPFSFDLTQYLKPGEQNVLAVRVNHKTPSSRWYSGSGLGRSVDLVVTDQVHVAKDGVRVTTPELAEGNTGSVKTVLHTTLENAGDAEVSAEIVQTVLPWKGDASAQIGTTTVKNKTIPAHGTIDFDAQIMAANPKLWSIDDPNLYIVRTEVKVNGTTVDSYDTRFGYRFFSFDADQGFSLNGRHMKIKGVCMHQDQGALGSVDERAALERQVKILKDMGANSIRTSHNTPSRVLVEVCEEQGMLLDEELFDGWDASKNGNTNDYARFFKKEMGDSALVGGDANKTWAQFDLEQSIARDANSPSVIMWSLGNEMYTGTSSGFNPDVQAKLIAWAKAADPTRPVTQGDNQLRDPNSTAYQPGKIHEAGGLVGANYADGNAYDKMHAAHPDWKLYGSETASAVNSRGVYTTLKSQQDAGGQQLTSYDTSCVSWGHLASQAWFDTIQRDYVAGEYVWTGFDYLGEPTPWNGTDPGPKGTWPSPKNSYFGIIDTAGLPKDTYYFYQSQWNDQAHTLHILPAWNKNMVVKQDKVPVVVYTDAPEVELFFTDAKTNKTESLGKKKFTQKASKNSAQKEEGVYTYQYYEGEGTNTKEKHKNLYLTWDVPYRDGTITAKAFDQDGTELSTQDWDGRKSVTTTGPAKKLAVSVDTTTLDADGHDLAYVTVDVTDEAGNIVPDAKNSVKFEVSGAGALAGVDNGSSPDHQSYRDDNRRAFNGKLVGIVRAGNQAGDIHVKVSADGLAPAEVAVKVNPTPSAPDSKAIDSLFYSRFQYVKAGSSLDLPKTIEVRYYDGTSASKPVTWEEFDSGLLGKGGSFPVRGVVENVPVTVTVNVLDDTVTLLNYSAATHKGEKPVMPETRPAALPDGSIVNAAFPVTWSLPEDSAFSKVGTVEITGSANVFGQDVPVYASIRVQDETITIGDNIGLNGSSTLTNVTEDTEKGLESDSLAAINDGNTTFAKPKSKEESPKNQTCWSNYNASQKGDDTAEVTFNFNTQMRFGRINIFFVQDGWSATFPDAGKTKIQVSDDGFTWRDLPVRETIGKESVQDGAKVKLYTYDFDPTGATQVKLCFKNADKVAKADGIKPCVCVTEVQLMEAQGSYITNSTAKLAHLTVNGQGVPEAALEQGEFSTRALFAELKPEPADNASATVLPARDNKIKTVLESEDHGQRALFTVNLAVPAEDYPGDISLLDYPVSKITATAGSEEAEHATATEGLVKLAFDRKSNTMWHSKWGGDDRSNLWVRMDLEEPTEISALRYLPRQEGAANGVVSGWKVEYSTDDGKTWLPAGEGTWDIMKNDGYDKSWQTAQFDKPVKAKSFRFSATASSTTEPGANYMSAAEIRLTTVPQSVDISQEGSGVKVEVPQSVSVPRVDEEHPVDANALEEKLTYNDEPMVYGVDYLMSFEGNTKPGAARVTIEGIGRFSGTVSRDFTIVKLDRVLTGISVTAEPTKVVYTAGEKLDPAGLVLTLAYSDGSAEALAYNDQTAGDFTFDPSLDAALTEQTDLQVTVTYGGKTAAFHVRVDAAPAPGPNPPAPPHENPGNGGGGHGAGSNGGSSGSQTGSLPKTGDAVQSLAAVAAFGVIALGAGAALKRRLG